jgi:hypothetical protein
METKDRSEPNVLSPSEARALVHSKHMPHPTVALLTALGYEYACAPNLRRGAVTWHHLNLVKARPARHELQRTAVGHELGHICWAHSGDGRWCEARAWASQHLEERQADTWMLDYLLPKDELIPWIDLGQGLRLTRLAEMALVPIVVARRQLKRLDLLDGVWDDTGARAEYRRDPFYRAASGSP